MGNGTSDLSSDELKELVAKSRMTEEEIKQLKDHSGYLETAEFKKMFAWLASPNDAGLLDRLFKLYDYDKDGKISFQEVAVTLGLLSRGAPGEKVSLLFQLFDENRDEKLAAAEVVRLVNFIRTAASVVHPDAAAGVTTEQLMSLIDLNQDGQISRPEWTMCVLKNPKLRSLVLGDLQ